MVRVPEYETLAPAMKGRARDLPPAPRSIEPGVFDAILFPHRSLPNSGFVAVMSVVVAVNLAFGLAFFLKGAWPVLGFCGLDVFLVWLAFRLSYRQGRLRERVRVTKDDFWVSRVLPSGHESRWRLQPFWTRVAIEKPVRHESQLQVSSKGGVLILGSFLSPHERGEFAEALGAALLRVRNG